MIKNLDTFSKNIKGKIKFEYSLKNHTWLNIGGKAKIFFVPETLAELREFLLYAKKETKNFFIIGAGSNLLISENIQNRIFIKLGKNFNKISLTKKISLLPVVQFLIKMFRSLHVKIVWVVLSFYLVFQGLLVVVSE